MTAHLPEVGLRRAGEQILVIDDDQGVGDVIELLLQRSGHRCTLARCADEGMAELAQREFDLLITDLRLPDASGLDIVAHCRATHPQTQVILMTGYSTVESAIEALRRGANDYIIKPFDNDDFLFSVQRALGERRTRLENQSLRRSLKMAFGQVRILGESEGVKRLLGLIHRVAATDANVLIQGESGTGKELVAQAIHYGGARAQKPFVAVNCGAIPSELIESELFGHVKGAYTGATSASEGLIREASGGTLFLDEVSELPLQVQVKLLRVLQERQVRPVGSSHSFITDTRFLAASNRNLKESAEHGSFRADLYYRLNVIGIHVPPLRERRQDIELLARQFMRQFAERFDSPVRAMSPEFIARMHQHPWPGNVRELQNVIERAVILADGAELTARDWQEIFGDEAEQAAAVDSPAPPAVAGQDLPLSVEDYIRHIVLLYQDRCGEAELAQMLGIGRKALWARRKSWQLQRPRGSAAGEGS